MRTSLIWALVSLASVSAAESGIFSLKTYKNYEKHAEALRKRDLIHASKRDAFPVSLGNYPFIGGGFYFVNASVGTPPQVVQLDIDTGSSDVWMFGVHSCDTTTSVCAGGSFDETTSSSLTVLAAGAFEIQYFTEGSGVTGDYVGDDFTIGGKTISNLTMGVATQATSVSTGIMGIGFDSNEAIVGQGGEAYANLIDSMQEQGLIGVKSYSLYLDDLEADTGSIVFGGIDTKKFAGDLGILDIQPDSQSGTYSSFGVILSSVGVTDSSGSTVLTTSNMPNVVILDTGTAFTILPADLVNELISYFGAENNPTYSYVVRCDLGGLTGTLDYQFAGPTGPIVSVPFEELAIPIVDLESGKPLTDSNNNAVCRLGISAPSSDSEPLLFGDTFLRSAYVVYDLDNLQVGIAQTLFNETDSDIQLISASATGQNLPGNIASVVTTIVQTKTQDGEGESFITGTTPGTVNTAVGSAMGASALSGYKTTYSNGPTTPGATGASKTSSGANPTETKKSGAISVKALSGAFWMAGFAVIAAVCLL